MNTGGGRLAGTSPIPPQTISPAIDERSGTFPIRQFLANFVEKLGVGRGFEA
jgi:hypothetical protein